MDKLFNYKQLQAMTLPVSITSFDVCSDGSVTLILYHVYLKIKWSGNAWRVETFFSRKGEPLCRSNYRELRTFSTEEEVNQYVTGYCENYELSLIG